MNIKDKLKWQEYDLKDQKDFLKEIWKQSWNNWKKDNDVIDLGRSNFRWLVCRFLERKR